MLNILQLIPTLDRSGAEKQMVMLAKGLPRDRFRVEVATLTRLGAFESELRAHGIPVTTIRKRWKVDPRALIRLTHFLATREFDIVQTWIFAANTYGRIAARLAKVPVVIVTEMAVDLWKGRSERFIDRQLSSWCDRLVGNSNAVVEYYHQLGVSANRLAMIYSGSEDEPPVNGTHTVRKELGFDTEAPLVLFAGRLAEQKRVDDLIKALDLLQHVQPNLRAIIVGEGPLLTKLEELARAYNLIGRLQFLGHRSDVLRLMAAADLVVLPSAYEGLPNVVLEAMCLRKPVIATTAPGTTEVVVDGETGLLVPVGDVMLLARAMRDLTRDDALARRLGEGGHTRAKIHFRADTMIDQFTRLYEELARAKGLSVS